MIIAIFGGTNETTYKQVGKKAGVKVIHDDGLKTNASKMAKHVRKCDCIVVITGAISHKSMEAVKEINALYGRPIVFKEGRGATGAVYSGILEYFTAQELNSVQKSVVQEKRCSYVVA